VPHIEQGATVAELRRRLRERRYEVAGDLAVCEARRLVGLVTGERLLNAGDEARISEIMDGDPPVVAPGLDQELVAWKAVQRGENSLAVVDDQGRFCGLIPTRRLLAVTLAEHHEDLARLSGLLKNSLAILTSAHESIVKRIGHRLPWLLLGLLGALVSADLVRMFEGQLRDKLTLAFFLPAIVYLADAVGTQTEVLVVRGIAVGWSRGRMIRSEMSVGLIVGAVLALVAAPFLFWHWADPQVVRIVLISLVAACACASMIALLLPLLLARLGLDPAFGSGPLATVLQDLLSIVIFLRVAQWVL
jgi:magnesium transporter